MDLRQITNTSYPPPAGCPPATQQFGFGLSIEERPRKRRVVGTGSPGSSKDVGGHHESTSRSREELESNREHEGLRGSLHDHIPMILKRLATVELQLEMLKPASPSGQYAPDVASMRSILSPAMQGSSDARSHLQLSSQNGTTPIYNDRDRQLDGDVMDSLSLRRNLSPPENPPFGVWWTYTIEETLVWPILEFQGDINSGLDALMDSSDEDGSDSEDESSVVQRSSLGRRSKRTRVERVKRGLDDGFVVRELVENFLRYVHTKNPILDAAQLRVHAANIVENGLSWDGETCQVLLACALGAISYPWNISDLKDFSGPKTSPERYSIGQEYFNAAQKRLGGLWAHSSLISAQCLFMTGIFFMYTQEPIAGWRAFNSASIACRSYISKRLARKSRALPIAATRSLEQRLCWSCIKSEREIACEFGMETSGLNLIAYSTSLPTPPNGYASDINQPFAVEALGEAGSPHFSVPRDYEDQSWYYYLTEIMLRKLEMRIDIFFQDKRREAYRRAGESAELFFRSVVQALQEFDYQLTRYYESLPPVMQFPLDDLTPCSDELRHYLRWRLFSVRHDITLPALYILLHNDVSRWSVELVAELVQLANECLTLDINFLKMAITTHRHHTTWLGPRKGVRSALILIAAGKLAAQQLPGLERLYVPDAAMWEDGAQALVEGLQYWGRESRDCSIYLDILRQLHPVFRNQVNTT